MHANAAAATRLNQVDIELPMDLHGAAIIWPHHDDPAGVWGADPDGDTIFAGLAEDHAEEPTTSLAEVAAHPARLRMRWSGPVVAGHGSLTAARAVRTGSIGLSELAACGK